MSLIEEIRTRQNITKDQLVHLLTTEDESLLTRLKITARAVADSVYGNQIFIRGLIEFTNYCKNDCYYCGIRRSNTRSDRYRSQRIRSSPAARMATSLASVPLSCRAEKIHGIPTIRSVRSYPESVPPTLTVRSRFLLVKSQRKATSASLTPALTGICSGMKLPMKCITESSILRKCLFPTEKTVSEH